MTVMNLDKLEVWVRAKDFAVAIYKEVIPRLPASEKNNLADQLKRAASSIPANIAEGHGRYHFLDNVRYCYIARGSLTEVQSHLSLAKELDFLPDEIYKRMTAYANQSENNSTITSPTSSVPNKAKKICQQATPSAKNLNPTFSIFQTKTLFLNRDPLTMLH